MAKKLLNIISSGLAAEQTLELIKQRKSGQLKSLRSCWPKFDRHLLKGLDWNRMITFAGKSGSGKSMIAQQLKHSFIDYNPDQKFEVLSFEFEMLTSDQIARAFSAKLDKSTQELYSGTDDELTDEDIDALSYETKKFSNLPIYYVDEGGSVEQVIDTIWTFAMHRKLIEQDIGLVVSIDHALLVQGKGFNSEQERQILNDLCRSLINLKTKFAQQRGKIIIILLSQLNRDIESPERITNANLHYPTKSDIFGSDAIYQASDYVVVIHRPGSMEGMGDFYGPKQAGFPKGLPIVSPDNPSRQMIYWHLIKNRFGMTKILTMVEDYAHSKINEINLKP